MISLGAYRDCAAVGEASNGEVGGESMRRTKISTVDRLSFIMPAVSVDTLECTEATTAVLLS